jgi:formiminoglutamase
MVKKIKHHWESHRLDGQKKPDILLLGAPDDRGVLNVGGRVGAHRGPNQIRTMLGNLMLGIKNELGKIRISEGFDIHLGPTIETSHQNLSQAICDQLYNGTLPIILGGGHDYGFPHIEGVQKFLGSNQKLALINIDAHLDLRPPNELGITSGSPFYLALENKILIGKNLYEFGIQEHCNDISLYEYAQQNSVNIFMLDDLRSKTSPVATFEKLLKKLTKQGYKIVISFDIDSIQLSSAPGVSAPQVDGFTATEFLQMARLCGQYPSILSIGFFEYAPDLDENLKTARLVSTAIHRFMSAVSQRSEKKYSRPTSPVKSVKRLLYPKHES